MRAAVQLGRFEVGTEEWTRARAHGLGGSEVAAVLGLSPWESRFSLWHRKAGLAPPVPDNDLLKWGRRLEEPIAREFADQHPEMRMRRTGMWRNRHRVYQIASPDRLLTGPGGRAVYEGKTAYDDLGWGEPGTDEVPVYYRAQALWYLDALGLDTCHLAVLIGGSDYREYQITRAGAEDELVLMRSAAEAFMATLRAGQRPDIDAHTATYQLLREQHPDIERRDVDLPADIARAYLAALDDFTAAEDAKRRAAARVLDAMGTARHAVYDGTPIATRVPGRGPDSPPYLRAASRKETGQKVSAA